MSQKNEGYVRADQELIVPSDRKFKCIECNKKHKHYSCAPSLDIRFLADQVYLSQLSFITIAWSLPYELKFSDLSIYSHPGKRYTSTNVRRTKQVRQKLEPINVYEQYEAFQEAMALTHPHRRFIPTVLVNMILGYVCKPEHAQQTNVLVVKRTEEEEKSMFTSKLSGICTLRHNKIYPMEQKMSVGDIDMDIVMFKNGNYDSKPSIAYKHYSHRFHFNDQFGKAPGKCSCTNLYHRPVCWDGSAHITMANGVTRLTRDIREGDRVLTPVPILSNQINNTEEDNYSVIKRIFFLPSNGEEWRLIPFQGFYISAHHPVVHDGEWKMPLEFGRKEPCYVDGLYNFELERDSVNHTMQVNGAVVSTLGCYCGKRIAEEYPEEELKYGAGYWNRDENTQLELEN